MVWYFWKYWAILHIWDWIEFSACEKSNECELLRKQAVTSFNYQFCLILANLLPIASHCLELVNLKYLPQLNNQPLCLPGWWLRVYELLQRKRYHCVWVLYNCTNWQTLVWNPWNINFAQLLHVHLCPMQHSGSLNRVSANKT